MATTVYQPPSLAVDAQMKKKFDVHLDTQMKDERRIVWNLMKYLETNGWRVLGWEDSESYVHAPHEDSHKTLMECIFSVTEGKLIVQKDDTHSHWILIIIGNGVDIICDYSYTENDPDGFCDVMDAFDPEKYTAP